MNKYLLITLIYLQTESQEAPKENPPKFHGCKSDFFPNPETPRYKKLDFTEQCENLKTCSLSFSSTKEKCLQDFETSKKRFCSKITLLNLFKKKYCYKIVAENMKIARALDKNNFKSAFEAFIAMVSDDDGSFCLVNSEGAVSDDGCDNTSDRQMFLFVRLSNGKFVVKDFISRDCLDFESGFGGCDYDAQGQWMDVALGGDGNYAFIFNKDEQVLLVSDGDSGFEDVGGEVIISVVSGMRTQEVDDSRGGY